MDISIIITIIDIVALVFVGYVLHNQVQSQKDVINLYRDYISTLDIKRFREYSQSVDELSKKQLAVDKVTIELSNAREKNEYAKKYAKFSNEMSTLIVYLMNGVDGMSKEQKEDFIKEALPNTKEYILNNLT